MTIKINQVDSTISSEVELTSIDSLAIVEQRSEKVARAVLAEEMIEETSQDLRTVSKGAVAAFTAPAGSSPLTTLNIQQSLKGKDVTLFGVIKEGKGWKIYPLEVLREAGRFPIFLLVADKMGKNSANGHLISGAVGGFAGGTYTGLIDPLKIQLTQGKNLKDVLKDRPIQRLTCGLPMRLTFSTVHGAFWYLLLKP